MGQPVGRVAMFFAQLSTVVYIVSIVSLPIGLAESVPEISTLKNRVSWSVQSWTNGVHSYSPNDPLYIDTNNNSIREDEESPFSLSRRQTSYDSEAANKGACLMSQVQGNIMPQSIYTDYNNLGLGWIHEKDAEADDLDLIPDILEAQQWQAKDFHVFAAKFPQPWIGRVFEASFKLLVNPVAGVILVANAQSPLAPLVPKGTAMPDPPPLSRLSDFTFLAWQAACNGNPSCVSKLNWIIHLLIVNMDSEEIAQDVTGQQDNWPDWQHKQVYEKDTKEYFSIIGSPNGLGIAFAIGQHSATALGRKYVEEVAVFGLDHGGITLGLNFGFHLSDT